MAKGDYYFPFKYQRFYSSTTDWTEEQEGAYLRLLTYQFDKGSIPNDLKKIKKISPKAVKNWGLLSKKFVQNSEGNLINIVMDEIRNDIQGKKDKNLKNGKLGGRPKTERLENTKPNGYEKENPTVPKIKTQTEPIPITNNQKPNNRESNYSTKIFDAESALLENQIEMERICVITGKSLIQAKESLHKYHLFLQEKEQYPKSRPAIFAGFEKWLMNEKNSPSPQTTNGNPLRQLIV
jgi:hypothetical protein